MDIVVTQSVYIQKTHWLEMKFKMFLNVNNKEEATKRIMEAETSQYQIMWAMLKWMISQLMYFKMILYQWIKKFNHYMTLVPNEYHASNVEIMIN